jgi:hypothetical protein
MPRAVLIGLVLLLCLATVPLAGGRLTALADVRFGAPWLALTAIAVQIVVISIVPEGADWTHRAAHLASYGLIAAFLWVNRRLPFLWLAAIGGGLNLVAITANGGVMPADPDALATAGVQQERATSPTRRRSPIPIWASSATSSPCRRRGR